MPFGFVFCYRIKVSGFGHDFRWWEAFWRKSFVTRSVWRASSQVAIPRPPECYRVLIAVVYQHQPALTYN
jgi:hypothetical protein